MGAYPFTKLLWQRYFRPHQNPATVTASTFSISRKGTKNSRFSCSTCPEAPATLSSALDLSFLIGKTARRRVSRSNQIKISASMRELPAWLHATRAGDGPGARGHKYPRRVLHHKLARSLAWPAYMRHSPARWISPPPSSTTFQQASLIFFFVHPSWHWLVGVARQGG